MNNNDQNEGYNETPDEILGDEDYNPVGVIMWGLPLVLGLAFLFVLYLLFQ